MKPETLKPETPTLSIIIPAHNEAEELPYTLRSVWIAIQQIEPTCEVVVVDDASTDATAAIAQQTGAKVVSVNLRHIAAVRNAGARAASGRWLVFLDGDTRLPAETLRAAIRALGSGAVGGGCRVVFEGQVSGVAAVLLRLWNTVARVHRWAAGSFLFVQREAFERIGGFDERFFAAEEIFTSEKLKKLGPFTLLDAHITTSARKMHSHPIRDHLSVVWRSMFTLGRNLQSRDKLGLWYETERGAISDIPGPDRVHP